jgi:predicted CoA-binding protein
MNQPEVILDMLGGRLREPRSIAVVGLSDNPGKPSYSVSAYMQAQGYTILPVNPAVTEVLGERSYPSLADLPYKPDIVNVFRLPRFIPDIVEEMITLGFADVWVQLGITHAEAAARAEEHGIRVVMDRCILVEHRRLGLGPVRLPASSSGTAALLQ